MHLSVIELYGIIQPFLATFVILAAADSVVLEYKKIAGSEIIMVGGVLMQFGKFSIIFSTIPVGEYIIDRSQKWREDNIKP